jgi:tetratricopeptide (TPR) repeat protein
MKKIILLIECFILSFNLFFSAFSQNEKPDSIFENHVIPPRFPAKETTWKGNKIESIEDYLNTYIRNSNKTRVLNYALQGTEVIQFTVTSTGELTDVVVINSVSPQIDMELMKVLRVTSGKWNPAYQNGQPVDMVREVSVVFKLFKTDDFISMARDYASLGNKKLFAENNPKEALKYYDMGINLLPNEYALLLMRGICKYELGDSEGARKDWNRFKIIPDNGNNHAIPYTVEDISNRDGYAEMLKIILK